MRKHCHYILILFVVALGVLLSSCSSSEAGPKNYELRGETVPSLNKLLDGEGGIFDSEELPADEASQESESPQIYTYYYRDLPENGQTIGAYTNALLATEDGFMIVNATGKQMDPPDYSAETGVLVLSKPNFDLRKSLRVILSWEQTTAELKLYFADSSVSDPIAELALGQKSALVDHSSLTAHAAVSYLKSMKPSSLGLPGDSMDAYHVYFLDGKAMVDEISCLRLRVYEISPPEGSNAILATYLLPGDKSKLYRLDEVNNDIIELK